jgi:hypothetical protein
MKNCLPVGKRLQCDKPKFYKKQQRTDIGCQEKAHLPGGKWLRKRVGMG